MLWYIVIFMVIFALLLYLDCKKPNNFPFGPKWYPIVGSALTVHKYRKKYSTLCRGVKELSKLYENHNGLLGFKIGKDRVVFAIVSVFLLKIRSLFIGSRH